MDQLEEDRELVRNLTDMATAGDNGSGAVIAQEQKVIAMIASLRAQLEAKEAQVMVFRKACADALAIVGEMPISEATHRAYQALLVPFAEIAK